MILTFYKSTTVIKCLSLNELTNERTNELTLPLYDSSTSLSSFQRRRRFVFSRQITIRLFLKNIYTGYEIKIYNIKKKTHTHICPHVSYIYPSLVIHNFLFSLLSIILHIIPVDDSKGPPPLNNLIKDSLIARSVPPPRGHLA